MDYSGPRAMYDASEDWKRARRSQLVQQVVCVVKKCSPDLLSFHEVRRSLKLTQKVYRGLQEIEIARIRGSVGRYADFSANFLPRKEHLKERWQRVDTLVVDRGLAPIEVYQVGQAYFVEDGNHRVSVARQQGIETIEAYVWEYPTPFGLSAEADIDELLQKAEYAQFIGDSALGPTVADYDITFTSPGAYRDLACQVVLYRQQQEATGQTMSTDEAIKAWHQEIYQPAVEAIREIGLMEQFPDRTEADLFIWTWQNSNLLEELEAADPDTPDPPGS